MTKRGSKLLESFCMVTESVMRRLRSLNLGVQLHRTQYQSQAYSFIRLIFTKVIR